MKDIPEVVMKGLYLLGFQQGTILSIEPGITKGGHFGYSVKLGGRDLPIFIYQRGGK